MGNTASDGNGSAAQSPFDSLPPSDRHGWKVLSVASHSPVSGLGFVPYFSVLTQIDGVRLGAEESALVPLIQEGVAVAITVLNLSTLTERVVSVTPRRGWGAPGDGMLGLMIRHDWFDNAHLEAIHVLEVHHGSPAEKAGLRAHQDFLLGTSRIAFKGYDHLDLFLHNHEGKEGKLLVFNKDTFSVREVTISPSSKWGGAGALGCDVGLGFLHQLPIDGKRDVRFEAEGESGETATGATQQQQQQQAVPQQKQQIQMPVQTAPINWQPPQQQQQQQQSSQAPLSAEQHQAQLRMQQQQQQWDAHQRALAAQTQGQQQPSPLLPPTFVPTQPQQQQQQQHTSPQHASPTQQQAQVQAPRIVSPSQQQHQQSAFVPPPQFAPALVAAPAAVPQQQQATQQQQQYQAPNPQAYPQFVPQQMQQQQPQQQQWQAPNVAVGPVAPQFYSPPAQQQQQAQPQQGAYAPFVPQQFQHAQQPQQQAPQFAPAPQQQQQQAPPQQPHSPLVPHHTGPSLP